MYSSGRPLLNPSPAATPSSPAPGSLLLTPATPPSHSKLNCFSFSSSNHGSRPGDVGDFPPQPPTVQRSSSVRKSNFQSSTQPPSHANFGNQPSFRSTSEPLFFLPQPAEAAVGRQSVDLFSASKKEEDKKKRFDFPKFDATDKDESITFVPPGRTGSLKAEAFSSALTGSRKGSLGKEDLQSARVIYINDADRTSEGNPNVAGNKVRTSKYTLVSFLPRNLFEQFQRVAYIYFLVIVILNQIPQLAVFGRTASLFPLAFVLVVTAIKDGYEDWGRHRSDKLENNRTSLVWHGGFYQPKRWKEIRVGEMVRVLANEIVPCDMVLLGSSDPSGVAYIETLNLDGESNLKTRYSKQETSINHPEDGPVEGTLICEIPNRNIYEFQAYMDLDGVHLPLGPNNIILRGCEVKNTSWVVGVVVYAGKDTKAMLNSSGAQSKRSRLERQMNRETGWLVFFLLIICLVGGIGMGTWVGRHHDQLDNLPYYKKIDSEGNKYMYYGVFGEAIIAFLSCIIVFQIMVPIALYISLELVRLWQSHFMTRDMEMYHGGSNSRFQCRALNINEDLGQIKYIFSDKTGTLTENKMEFHSASVHGVDFNNAVSPDPAVNGEHLVQPLNNHMSGETSDNKSWMPKVGTKVDADLMKLLQSPSENGKAAREFMLVLAACNTVVPTLVQMSKTGKLEMQALTGEPGNGYVEYQGESPDEQALVSAASSYGYVLLERSSDSILLKVMGENQRYQILGIHEFDSIRKRMSVIVQCPDGTIKVLVKGADSAVLDIVARKDQEVANVWEEKEQSGIYLSTMAHLEGYSRKGLRTLVVASRELDVRQYQSWRTQYQKASTSLNDRVGMLRQTAELVEDNLTLLGATAIEDKLQDGVPDTIALLREAGMKVWVLTGDKQQTAISIGFSCLLLTNEMQQITINETSKEGCREALLNAKLVHGIVSGHGKSGLGKDRAADVGSEHLPRSSISTEAFVSMNGLLSSGSFSGTGGLVSSGGNMFKHQQLALIIDGNSLVHALSEDLEHELYEVAMACKVVICCRVAPLQKAAVVSLMKRKTNELTLAIGDGANDVSMIQMADVGIGLSGQEGRQAVMASDYAMGQFRFLRRLILVHGHWNYQRLAYMVLYNFYRNAVFVMMLFWYILYTAFSPQTAVTDWSSVFYSLIYTSIPTVVVATLDKDLSHRTLLKFPALYCIGQRQESYNQSLFWITMLDTVWQSLVVFYVPYLTYQTSDIDIYGMGCIWTFGVVILVNLHLAMDVQRWNWLTHAAIWGSILATFICLIILDSLTIDALVTHYGTMTHMMSEALFWLDLLLIIIVALFPRFCVIVMRQRFWPSDIQIAREAEIRRGDFVITSRRYPVNVELSEVPTA